MDWSAIGGMVAHAAPTIGSLLGGLIPFPGGSFLGELAGKALATALGVPPTPEAVKNAIETRDPAEVQAALSEAEARIKADVEKYRAQLEDVQDARNTMVELVKSGSSLSWGAAVVSIIVTTGFIGCIFVLMMVKVNFTDTGGQAFLILTGILSQAFGQVVSYWLGSSAGSSDKSAQIAALSMNAQMQKGTGNGTAQPAQSTRTTTTVRR